MQRVAKGGGHRLFGQVILGRAQPAREHQQFAAGARLGDEFPQARGVVANDVLVQHADAQLGQFAA